MGSSTDGSQGLGDDKKSLWKVDYSIMKYILATTTKIKAVEWYLFDPENITPGQFKLTKTLNFSKVPVAHNKDTAKQWAMQLGLSTWRYVKI